MIGAIAVVIPARDESELIGRCLESVLAAAAQVRAGSRRETGADNVAIADADDDVAVDDVAVDIVVVADRCTDDTAEVARRYPGVTVIEIDAGNVGIARATGVMLALESSELQASTIWIANTDADSAVPTDWLVTHLSLARAGADMILGTVLPDFADLTDGQAFEWAAAHASERVTDHREVYGANLGVRADLYLAVGGFPSVAEHEDVALVERCSALGVDIVSTDRCEVLTSGRRVGRTPGGFARYLRDDLVPNPAH